MTYLFIVAHVDDAEVSCAGFIQKLLPRHHVKVISLSHVYDGIDLMDEFTTSMTTLGVEFQAYNTETRRFNAHINHINKIIYDKTRGYNFVITHDCKDRHDDHRIVAEQVRRVYNGNLLTFGGPWNMDENSAYFVSLTENQVEKKIEALSCYKSQSHRPYMNPDFIRGWARYNGIKASVEFAEAFKIERLVQ